jgi:hypothetical protein
MTAKSRYKREGEAHQTCGGGDSRIVSTRIQITSHIHAYNHSTGRLRRISLQQLTTCAAMRKWTSALVLFGKKDVRAGLIRSTGIDVSIDPS